MSSITTTTLDNGLVLVIQEISSVASAAVSWLVPAGSATDSPEGDGVAAMLSEIIFRGAGPLNSRQHSDALDRLGVERSARAGTHHIALGATMLGSRAPEALPLLIDMIRSPLMPEDSMEAVRSLALQSLQGLQDDPQHLVMLRLRQHHVPAPFNRHGYGEEAILEGLTIEDLRAAAAQRFVPGGSILAIAGGVNGAALIRLVSSVTRGWSGVAPQPRQLAPAQRGTLHIPHDSAQVHFGAAWDAPPEKDPDSMVERLAVGVLSGSSSARLFTEVRQKRSLCYSVGAAYASGRDDGMVSLYSGTTPQRANETLQVALAEVERLRQGALPDEFRRAVVGLKSSLVMQGESTTARAAALARDQFRLGRPRSLAEVAAEVDRVTLDRLNAYLARRIFAPYTIASIGPVDLETSKCQTVKTSK